jgi:ATP-dependent protease ClpP protease subunit
MARSREEQPADDQPAEIAIVGDLSEREADLTEKLLEVPAGGACTLYFDCPGGSAYTALSVTTLMLLRGLEATGIVTGECSSAALWPLAACRRRVVTRHSVLLFHPMKWHSEEHVGIAEAAEWARHFGHLEDDMDHMLARLLGVPLEKIAAWLRPGRYVSGREFHEFGFADLVEFEQLLAGRAPASGGRKSADSRSRKK